MSLLSLLLFGFVARQIDSSCYPSEPSRSLFTLNSPVQIEFIDFDRTMTIASFGRVLLDECILLHEDGDSMTGPCSEIGALTSILTAKKRPVDFVKPFFGGQERIDRIRLHLQRMQGERVRTFILSTSWEPVPALEWQLLLWLALDYAGLSDLMPLDSILALADPGPGISANKGGLIQDTLTELKLTSQYAFMRQGQVSSSDESSDSEGYSFGNFYHQNYPTADDPEGGFDACIFADDSSGNMETAVKYAECDRLWVRARAGLGPSDFEYLEARAVLSGMGIEETRDGYRRGKRKDSDNSDESKENQGRGKSFRFKNNGH